MLSARNILTGLDRFRNGANHVFIFRKTLILKIAEDKEVLASLEVIEEQGRKIDAVIESLREATEMKMGDYTTDGEVTMIDIERDVEDRLKQR